MSNQKNSFVSLTIQYHHINRTDDYTHLIEYAKHAMSFNVWQWFIDINDRLTQMLAKGQTKNERQLTVNSCRRR